MTKRENHWYLVGSLVDALARIVRPGVWTAGLWLALLVTFLVALQAGALDRLLRNANSPMFVPVLVAGLLVASLGAGVLLPLARRASARSAYLKALASPSPETLIQVVERSMRRLRALPDVDALLAQSKAIAYALYGREQEAVRSLGAVDWNRKAPLIQAIGLSAESVVELLCRREPVRAVELARKARAMSSVNAAVPGSAQAQRYHDTCVAVGEALSNIESPTGIRALEESSDDGRYPPLQLLATFGLAAAMQRSGNSGRAAELRDRLRQVAPHCSPILGQPEQFAASAVRSGEEKERPVSSAVSSPDAVTGTAQERSAKRKIFKFVAITAGIWVALGVLFLVMQAVFSRPH